MYPKRGEIWLANLDHRQGHEQSGTRPVLILSINRLNQGLSNLVTVLPITSKKKNIPFHVEVVPPEGGLDLRSYVLCEQIRTISKERLDTARGAPGHVSTETMAKVAEMVRQLNGL